MRRLAGRVRTALRHRPRAVLRAAWVLILLRDIERSLRRLRIDEVARRYGATLSFEEPASVGEIPLTGQAARDLALTFRVLNHPSVAATCLRRSLVLTRQLRRHHPLLRIGVAKAGGAVSAHAWVEVDGVSLDPMADRDFAVLRRAGAEPR